MGAALGRRVVCKWLGQYPTRRLLPHSLPLFSCAGSSSHQARIVPCVTTRGYDDQQDIDVICMADLARDLLGRVAFSKDQTVGTMATRTLLRP